MGWVYLAIAAVLAAVFLRADVQLLDLVFDAQVWWSSAAALVLLGVLIGGWLTGRKTAPANGRWAFWGGSAVVLLALVEYTVEWNARTALGRNETVILSAASAEETAFHVINGENGLYRTRVALGGQAVEVLVDTGASLVLLNANAAAALGIETDNLSFEAELSTPAGPLRVARLTLDELNVGPGIRLTDVPAAVSQSRDHPNLLGASALNLMTSVTIRGNQMTLRKDP
ncbi:MAG: TIGR02281 family clan AA aspartic protease [Pseudomonadota bacterium]